MPKDLTDIDEWKVIAVPVGTDPAVASSVETPFQSITNRTRYLKNILFGMRALNYKQASLTAGAIAALASDQIRGLCFDASLNAFTALTKDGYTIYSYHLGDGGATPAMGGHGYAWDDEGTQNPNGIGGSWVNNNTAIVSNQNGQRIVINFNIADTIAISSALNTWTTQATSGSGNFWYDIDHDKSGLYVIVGLSGVIQSSPDGTTWTARTSGVGENFVSVRHSYDSNNSYWVALTTNYAAHSADGITWSNNTHSLPSTPANKCLAYSKVEGWWGAVLQNGDMAWSDDNGATWNYDPDPFGLGPGPITGLDKMHLECDGNGTWIFDYSDLTASTPGRRWVSVDDGFNWYEVFDGMDSGGDLMRVCFGNGLFAAVGRSEIYTSLRQIGA